MKKYIVILITTMAFTSCEKPSARPNNIPPAYVGTYLSINRDTVNVTEGQGGLTVIHYLPNSYSFGGIVFDSVIVNSDLTFTDNEEISFFGNYNNIGTGRFGTNTIHIDFSIGYSSKLLYDGIKH
jgi:hypothetical protein